MSHRQRQQERTLTFKVNDITVTKIGRGVYSAFVKIEGEELEVTGSKAHVTRACYQSEPNYKPEYVGYAGTLCQACDDPLDKNTATCGGCGAKTCTDCHHYSPYCPVCDGELYLDIDIEAVKYRTQTKQYRLA